MSAVVLRPSFIRALGEAQTGLRELASLLPEAQTPEERIALLRALQAKAYAVIVLIDQVLARDGL